jgi:PhnB protein
MTRPFQSNSPSALLTVKGASAAITYYCEVFGAEEVFRLVDPSDGRIGNALLRIGDGTIMVADEYPEVGALGPKSEDGDKARLHLYMPSAQATVEHAVAKGAQVIRPLELQFFGDQMGVIEDPFGHEWMIATKIESVSAQEMQTRWNDMMKQ